MEDIDIVTTIFSTVRKLVLDMWARDAPIPMISQHLDKLEKHIKEDMTVKPSRAKAKALGRLRKKLKGE
jgi:hypothetical protein